MKLISLTHRPSTASTRYRTSLLLPVLREHGIQVDCRQAKSGLLASLRSARGLEDYDVVIVQKRLFSGPTLRRVRSRARRLVYDFDDAVYLRRDGDSPTRRRRFSAMVKAADLPIAGNAFLAQAARRAGARRVEILPTALDPDRYRTREHGASATLSWIGGGGNLPYLESIMPALEQAASIDSRLRLRVICDRFPGSCALSLEKWAWSERTEAQDLAGSDIGLAPLPDEPWTRGKCGLKILQYMAAGLPVVASPVGVQADIVEDGRTGVLASSPEEWTRAVLELAADPEKRQRFGQAGRAKVERAYSGTEVGRQLAELLEA